MNKSNSDLLVSSIGSLIKTQAALQASLVANAMIGGGVSAQVQELEDLVAEAQNHLTETIKFVFKNVP